MTGTRPQPLRLVALLGLGLGLALGVAACGKKGSPEPPGPPGEVTYPRTYPAD